MTTHTLAGNAGMPVEFDVLKAAKTKVYPLAIASVFLHVLFIAALRPETITPKAKEDHKTSTMSFKVAAPKAVAQAPVKKIKPKILPKNKVVEVKTDKPLEEPKEDEIQPENVPYTENLDAGTGTGGGDQTVGETSNVIPLEKSEPKYPKEALMSGTEGWVLLKYDITATGEVENIEILDANPRDVFDKASKQALRQWKFKPQMVNGVAVAQKGKQVKIEFKLDQSNEKVVQKM